MSISSEKKEIGETINRLLDNLALTISSRTGDEGARLRRKIGDLRANYIGYLTNGTFVSALLDCFTEARNADVKLASLFYVHRMLFEEEPVGQISSAIVETAISFCLSAESRMITSIEFTSRDDVEKMMKTMKEAFDTARELASEGLDSSLYLTLTYLAGSLTNHLSNVSRQLPRMIKFTMPTSLPALALSQRIYYNVSRWEEIIEENKIVHPAFCPREITGLSS